MELYETIEWYKDIIDAKNYRRNSSLFTLLKKSNWGIDFNAGNINAYINVFLLV